MAVPTHSTASKIIEEKQLPAVHAIEIYSGIAQFLCDSTAFLVEGLIWEDRNQKA